LGVAEASYFVGDLGKASAEPLEFAAGTVVIELTALHLHQVAKDATR
jgi:hypothetical protein